ncbi:RsmB/NOP family class I SAM-dependent RNA methyltransferase [Rathayibacter soli]|uniref:RsmB/NOP family class I SAM-dependent RNA methyltransferase n=1 Tax=Rathayibacter soli TaxID=3144168 RepID=UPI0027E4E17D|nr:transcription antitermination factor NusB [Glaciibacter superstes]
MSGERPEGLIQPARRIAYDVIAAVRESDAYANLLLPMRIDRAKLAPADAAFATELTYGTLRMRGYYDRVIALAARRGIDEIDPPIVDVLRLGVHQLLATRVAQHAAVNESVALARTVGSRSATGFTNGVLRTITRSTPEEWRERVLAATAGDDERRAAEFSHPEWIVRAFAQALAAEGRRNELDELLDADNRAPKVNMIALPGVADAPQAAERNRYSPFGFVFGGGDPHSAVRSSAGALRVQDEGSQLAAIALAAARPIAQGERWLDLCAGPGGKAALLGALARQGGARLVANELVPARAELVRAAVRPVADTVEVRQGDGRLFGEENAGVFDRVLLDAPCTGLGALRRRPEARWRKVPHDVAELTALQARLLDSAVLAMKPGGVLAYVTCSPHLAESRLAVTDALKRHGAGLEPMQTQAILGTALRHPLEKVGDPTQVQLWPHRHGTDAMFIALLCRR